MHQDAQVHQNPDFFYFNIKMQLWKPIIHICPQHNALGLRNKNKVLILYTSHVPYKMYPKVLLLPSFAKL